MLFNSYIFIFIFLPLAFSGYFLLNHIKRYPAAKFFLVSMSLWFYAYFHINYLWIILFSIGINYLCHRLILRGRHSRAILVCGVFANVGLLFYFKYFHFLMENINALFHADFSLPEILLPLGISFFTFQQIAFLADSAGGKISRQKLLDYALFVTFFPQLIAGPIVSHDEMLPQFNDMSKKRIQAENVYRGLRLFVLGLGKKVLLADTFGQAVNWGFRYYTVLDGLNTFLVILFYTFQIYFDFSGYCDMARGIGCLFNIRIPVNFLSPYKAKNISEFWDRWHITLTRFFTRYIYIPLGGSRKGLLRACVNVLLVFLISGIWHGAGWTYVIWGLLHGVLSVLTRVWRFCRDKISDKGKEREATRRSLPDRFLSVCLTFLFVCCAWTFFRADTVAQAVYMLKKLVTGGGTGIYLELALFFQPPELLYCLKLLRLDALPFSSCFGLAAFTIAAMILIFFCRNLYESEEKHKPAVWKTVCLSVLAVWCIVSLSGVSTFLYFNF
ncbi:MAG: MBOAT family protein [bacterium]|nr:MBOAT family protein [bacterium]